MIPKIELAETQEIKAFQEQKLKELMLYLKEKSPFYQDMFLSTILMFLR